MKKNNILPVTDLQNSREYVGAYNSRDFYKGTSFKMAGEWITNTHYFNDEYIVDFVSFEGALLSCIRSHTSSSLNMPELVRENDKIIGIKPNLFWAFVMAGVEGPTGKVWVPEINNGILSWKESNTPPSSTSISDLKGPAGDTPIIGIKKDTSNNHYYWTVSINEKTEWIFDDSGQKVLAEGLTGATGAPGIPGEDGEDGITPQLKIEDGYWFVSYDKNDPPKSWIKLGQAKGDKGDKGDTGKVVEIIDSLESDRTDAALSAAQGKALKTLVDELKASVAAALDYKGTKDTYEELPAEGNKKGDVWNVVGAHGTTPAGTNYAWDGTQWDPLGGTIDLSGYYTKTQVDDAISAAKTELEAADTALEGQITTVTNQLNNKVDKVEGSGLISDTDLNQIRTNKSDIESLQTSVGGKQDELTPGNAVSITEENVIDVKLDPASNEALSKSAEGLKLDLSGIKGSTVKVGVSITGGAEIGADQTIAAGMQALSDSIRTAVAGGITSLTSPDETITVTGTGTSRALAVNVSKLVSASSSIKVGDDGKLDMYWTEVK